MVQGGKTASPPMYPGFCSYRLPRAEANPYVLAAAELSNLAGDYLPGLALGEASGLIEVIVAPDGTTRQLAVDSVRLGLSEAQALNFLDQVEEAIEDAIEAGDDDRAQRIEQTLDLLDQCLSDGDLDRAGH
jgi:hypothetical protein